MIKKDNLEKIYDAIIDGMELTTKNLNQLGFKSKDLANLIEEGKLVRVQRGLYSLNKVDEFYYYGRNLLGNKEYDKATMCFNKCHEIDPNHSPSCFQLFLRAIRVKDYDKAIELYDRIANTDNENYNADARFYLYIMSLLTELPEKYNEYARTITYQDVKIKKDDKRFEDAGPYNDIRRYVLGGKISYAVHKMNDIVCNKSAIKVNELITKTLLYTAVNEDFTKRATILNLVKEKKYEEVIEFLLGEQRKYNLLSNDEYVLKLSRKILEIKESKVVPRCEKYDGDIVFSAIQRNDYKTALLLSSKYNEKMGIQDSDNPINILLTDICELINTLSVEEEVVELEEVKETPVESNDIDNLSTIISYLLKKDYDSACDSLTNCLISMGKQNYVSLIKTLIQIGTLENDPAWAKALLCFAGISQGMFNFNVSEYISEFYMALSQNKKDIAKLYLDIISNSKTFGGEEIDTTALYKVLGINEVKEEKKVEETPIVESVIIDNVIDKPIKLNKVNKVLEVSDSVKNDERYVAKKYSELVSKDGVVLLNQMDEERANRILDIVLDYPDMIAYTIGAGNKTQVVLVYKPRLDKRYNCRELIAEGSAAYKSGDYQKCIDIHLILLKLFDIPRATIYVKLGLAYKKLYDKESAIKYLTIATDLASKEDGNTFDASDLILALQGGFDSEESRAISRVHMDEDDFDSDNLNDFYGIENFDELNEYIINSGLDIESACEQLSMTAEEINIVRLAYAREYYIMSNFVTGDLFLNTVERSKDKTPEIKKIIKEIKASKQFYQTRILTEARPVIKVLKPKKGLNKQ